VRVVQRSLNIIDCGIGHAAALQNLKPFLRGLLLHSFLNQAINIRTMLYSITVGNESGIGLPFRVSKSVAQHTKQPIVPASEKNIAIERLVAAVRHNGCLQTVSSYKSNTWYKLLTVCGSPSSRILLATDQSGTGNIRQCRNLTVAQTRIDMLSLTSPRPRKQGGHNGIRGVQASRQVGHSNANFHRLALSTTRDMHQAHLRFNHDIVPRTIAVWPGLTISGDAGVDKFGIDRAQSLIIHVIFLKATRKVVLDEDVTFFRQPV
jgi:hypothetical protein